MGSILQTSQYLNKPLRIYPHSTLNEKLDISKDVQLAAGELPAVKYITIGDRGHGFIVGHNNKVKWQAVHHTPRHNALYNHLPFVLRPLGTDLEPAQRNRYRLRRLETHNGQQYFAYYLRVLDLTNVEPTLEYRHVLDGNTIATPYEPTIEDLNPIPPTLVTGSAVITTGDYVAATARVPFVMSPEDTQEFIDACLIINGEPGYALISEVGLVSGVDRVVTKEFNGQNQTYTEAIYAQITAFISTAWVMEQNIDGVKLNIDVGNVEPLLDTIATTP
jgi:hypothetical protein